MASYGELAFWDYCVIGLVMFMSVGIGWYFRLRNSGKHSANELLMANRSMGRFPVIFSLVVSKMSAISLMGEPADIYKHGTQRYIASFFIFVGAYLAAYVFLPVFFSVGATTIYAYLGRRFGSITRFLISIICFIQMIFQLAVILYAPALALDAVTSFNINTSIILMSVVCILFSVMGGMRAVMWADVFQSSFMYICILSVIILGIREAGGCYSVYKTALDGGRLQFFEFSFDSKIRYTFWNALALGIQYGIVALVTNQTEIQRVLTIPKLKDAQSAVLWYSIPAFLLTTLINISGVVLYAVLHNNDPMSKESGIGLEKADQILPYFIISRMTFYPGLAGLCVSGLFFASITTLSSAINTMSTIVIDDFIIPRISSETAARINFNLIAKLFMVLNGAVITLMPFILPFSSSLYEIIVSLYAIMYGPLFGLYLLGMLSETANEKGSLLGLFSGIIVAAWKTIGSKVANDRMLTGYLSTNYSTVTDITQTSSRLISHNYNFNSTHAVTNDILKTMEDDDSLESSISLFYRLSFTWTGLLGIVTTCLIGYTASFVLNYFYKNQITDPHLLSPVTKYWIKPPPEKINILLEEKETKC